MLDHCNNYLRQKYEKRAYDVYVTDALKVIADNTAKTAHGGGYSIRNRFAEMVRIDKQSVKRADDAGNIINRIKGKLNAMSSGSEDKK